MDLILMKHVGPVLIILGGKKKLLVAHRFPCTLLSENRALLGTDNVRGQISEHIFVPNGDYCLYSIQVHHLCFFCGQTNHVTETLKQKMPPPLPQEKV